MPAGQSNGGDSSNEAPLPGVAWLGHLQIKLTPQPPATVFDSHVVYSLEEGEARYRNSA